MDKLAYKTKEILDECIEDMNKKKDLTSADLEMLCKAYKLRRELMYDDADMGESSEWDNSSSMYSRRNVMPRVYMDGMNPNTNAYAPMRSPVTGRYISRDGGMSGHSLKDRMIAKLEGMYDEAQSEYEREELRKEIRRIESEK